MIVLAVHSTSPSLGIAITEGDRILGEKTFPPSREHLERLAPAIGDLFRELGITPGTVEGFGVAKGPGSFSGIRVGMATVKGMALALDRPAIGISDLEILAYQTLVDGATGAAVIDARRGEIYTAVYGREGPHARLTQGPMLIQKEALKAMVEQLGRRVVLCCAESLAEELAELTPLLVRTPEALSPAAACAMIAWEKLRTGRAADLHALEPLYIRRSDAEEKETPLHGLVRTRRER